MSAEPIKHSEDDLRVITDLVFWHELPALTEREIAQRKSTQRIVGTTHSHGLGSITCRAKSTRLLPWHPDGQPKATFLSTYIIASSRGLLLIAAPTKTIARKQKPLLVFNLLTKKCRELPDLELSSWDDSGVQAHMVVDEEADPSEVIITFREIPSDLAFQDEESTSMYTLTSMSNNSLVQDVVETLC